MLIPVYLFQMFMQRGFPHRCQYFTVSANTFIQGDVYLVVTKSWSQLLLWMLPTQDELNPVCTLYFLPQGNHLFPGWKMHSQNCFMIAEPCCKIAALGSVILMDWHEILMFTADLLDRWIKLNCSCWKYLDNNNNSPPKKSENCKKIHHWKKKTGP